MHAPGHLMPINRNTSTEELFRAATIELNELKKGQTITLQLKPLQAWALLGNLQLALAHERNQGTTARIGYRIAKQLERAVAATPALREVARRGWQRRLTQWLQ
jgi:hypothetical protein